MYYSTTGGLPGEPGLDAWFRLRSALAVAVVVVVVVVVISSSSSSMFLFLVLSSLVVLLSSLLLLVVEVEVVVPPSELGGWRPVGCSWGPHKPPPPPLRKSIYTRHMKVCDLYILLS